MEPVAPMFLNRRLQTAIRHDLEPPVPRSGRIRCAPCRHRVAAARFRQAAQSGQFASRTSWARTGGVGADISIAGGRIAFFAAAIATGYSSGTGEAMLTILSLPTL